MTNVICITTSRNLRCMKKWSLIKINVDIYRIIHLLEVIDLKHQ